MDLGAFSVSLAVQDLDRSRRFYEGFGFVVAGGDAGYVILRQGRTVLGLFQGMFEGNILTFNPGLRANEMETEDPLTDWRVEDFDDVRDIQQRLVRNGTPILSGVDEVQNPNGPASLTLSDPDGNVILIDQFFPRPSTRK